MRTLCVTGGIGSGKSVVCRLLEKHGFPVYDCDGRTKKLYDSDPELLSNVIEAMRPYCGGKSLLEVRPQEGGEPMIPGRRLDRRVLAGVVFGNEAALKALEAVVHPAVLKDFLSWRSAQKGPLAVMESAIILEKPLFREVIDIVLLVDAPVELRRARAASRDRVPGEAVEARMAGQTLLNDISDGKAEPPADYVILNDGSEAQLADKLEDILNKILNNNED